jgi:hypothetical protein
MGLGGPDYQGGPISVTSAQATAALDNLQFFHSLLNRIANYDFPDQTLYATIRAELVTVPGLSPLLPRYVREYDDPREVWSAVSGLSPRAGEGLRAGRRRQIGEGLRQATDWLQRASAPPSTPATPGRPSGPENPQPVPSAERKVVVLGPDVGEGLVRLRAIQTELKMLNQPSHLIRELTDVADQSLEQKVRFWCLAAPYVVIDDKVAAGHIREYELCKDMGVTLIVLRERGTGSTRMISDTDSLSYPFIKFIEYDPGNLGPVIKEGDDWAKDWSAKKAAALSAKESWRTARGPSGNGAAGPEAGPDTGSTA